MTEPPCYIKGLWLSLTLSCLSSSSCKQCSTISWGTLCHWVTALCVLWAALPVSDNLHSKEKCLWGRQQFQSEKFKSRNIMSKFRWVKMGRLMIHPDQPDSIHQSSALRLCASSLYTSMVCLQESSTPVHHLISLGLSNAWIAKWSISRDFMNTSEAIKFVSNQKLTLGLHREGFSCSIIIAA